jgi:hypothetical protein
MECKAIRQLPALASEQASVLTGYGERGGYVCDKSNATEEAPGGGGRVREGK